MSEEEAVKRRFRPVWLVSNAAGEGLLRWSLLPLRVMVGAIMFAHGAQKGLGLFGGGGFGGTVEMLKGLSIPLPGPMAVLLVLAELVGGAMLIVGLAPRLAAAANAIVMIVALLTAHRGQGFFDTHLQQMILVACVTIFLAGGGELALQRSKPKG